MPGFRSRTYYGGAGKIKNWSLKIPASRREAGDTIIEVVFATVIMGIILFTAYGLSNQSVKLGIVARERSQASQLAQEQAEGLRALRDSATSWAVFRDQIRANSGSGTQTFHVERDATNRWVPRIGTWNPANQHTELSPNLYTVSIRFYPAGSTFSGTADHLRTIIEATWQRFGGGPPESSIIYYNLTDRNISF